MRTAQQSSGLSWPFLGGFIVVSSAWLLAIDARNAAGWLNLANAIMLIALAFIMVRMQRRQLSLLLRSV